LQGIWQDEFEGSAFFEGALTAESVKREIERRSKLNYNTNEWLDWLGPATGLPAAKSSNSRMIRIDFIGRRTAYPGRYGHFGMSRTLVLVDRVISAEVIYEAKGPYLEYELDR